MLQSRIAPRGVSLIEVILVGAIIALILSLSLPAFLDARESGRRTTCMNNLRQLTQGLHTYETLYRFFPPGVYNPAGPVAGDAHSLNLGWIGLILREIDNTDLADSLVLDAGSSAPENTSVARVRISIFVCPSDAYASAPGMTPASSYAGCHHDVEAPVDVSQHGMLFRNSRLRLDDVPDGTSNTFLLGERRQGAGGPELGWLAGNATLRNTGTQPNAPFTPPGDPALAVGGFGSGHAPGGANFAFVDGSVRWVSNRVDPWLYRSFGHRADGNVINDGAY